MSFFDYPGGQTGAAAHGAVILAEASAEDWHDVLRDAETRRYRPGETILKAGDAGRSLCFIVEGSVQAVAPATRFGRPRPLGVLGAGSVIGEMGFFDAQPRSASVQAVEAAVVAQLDLEHFQALAERRPDLAQKILFDLGRILALRLRDSEKARAQR